MSSGKRAGTPVRGSGMPGAGMHSKVTFEEDEQENETAKEKRDLTAAMEEAARGTQDRKAKDKPQEKEPTPRKGEKFKQARRDDTQKGAASSDQAAMEVEPEAEIAHPGSMTVNMEMLGKVQQVLNDQVQALREELREARVIANEQKHTIDKQGERIEALQRVTNTNMITATEKTKREGTQRCTTSWACPKQPPRKKHTHSSNTSSANAE